jgi:hypothetical protein
MRVIAREREACSDGNRTFLVRIASARGCKEMSRVAEYVGCESNIEWNEAVLWTSITVFVGLGLIVYGVLL